MASERDHAGTERTESVKYAQSDVNAKTKLPLCSDEKATSETNENRLFQSVAKSVALRTLSRHGELESCDLKSLV
jgi:hypothetical protein